MSDDNTTPEAEPEVFRDSGGAWAIGYDDPTNHYTVVPPARPQAAPQPEGEGNRDGKGRFRRKTRTEAAEPATEQAAAADVDVDDDTADDGWMPPGANVTTTPAEDTAVADGPGDGSKKDSEENKDDDGSPLMMVGGFLVLATVGGGIILVNTVSGVMLAVGGAGAVVATGLGVAGYRAVKNRIKNGPRNRNGSADPWSLLPMNGRAARRAQRKAARKARKAGLGLGLGLPAAGGPTARRRAAGTGGRKAGSSSARSSGLPKMGKKGTGLGLPKGKGGAGLGLPKIKGTGPGRRSRSGAGVGKVTGPGHASKKRPAASTSSKSKPTTAPKGTAPKGTPAARKKGRAAAAHVTSMPRTSLAMRRRLNRMSPHSRQRLRKDLNRADNLSPTRRRKVEDQVTRADARYAKRATQPVGAKRAGRIIDDTLALGVYGVFKLGQALYRVTRAGWTYATPHRHFTEAHAREFWRNAAQEFTAGQRRDTRAAGAWDAERQRQAEQARQRQQERAERVAREREQRRRERAEERRRAQERRAAGQRPPIRVKVTVGEPIRDQRPRPRPNPHPVAATRNPLPLGVQPARRVAPPSRAIESTDAFDDGARDTDPPIARPNTAGKPISIKPATSVRPPRFTGEPKENTVAVAAGPRTWRDTQYQPHPAHAAMIQAHGLMFSNLPSSPKAMKEHLVALAVLYVECGQHVSGAGRQLPSQYPVEREMHSYYEEYAKAYRHLGDATMQVAAAYAAANERDVHRAEHPRPNEEWNDVPAAGEMGVDMGPIREQFRQAHLDAWNYRYTDPLDLRAWLGGLYATNHILAEHIDPNMRFPGAGVVLFDHWHNLSATWEAIGNHSFVIVEGYEFTANDVLERHRNPRVNEHLANAKH